MKQNNDVAYLLDVVNEWKVEPPERSIVKFIEARRVIPAGKAMSGPFQFSRTPYLREIQECLSPYSPIQEIAVMKSAQIGITEVMLNGLAYYMCESPCDMLYVSGTQDLLKRFGGKRLEPLVDSIGMRGSFTSPVEDLENYNTMSRRSGDKLLSKDFPGGSLYMGSLNSLASLRSDSVRVLLLDEIEAARNKTEEGSSTSIAVARTDAYGDQRKIMYVSTPSIEATSTINKLYLKGDQRKYLVPCPHCHVEIELLGPALKLIDGVVYYICQKCGSAIKEKDKNSMLANGTWHATVNTNDPTFRSYHINSLYAPRVSWSKIYREYETVIKEEDDQLMKAYVNLKLGLPYKEINRTPESHEIEKSPFSSRVVPPYILYCTIGVDVQQGGKDRSPRLAVQVVGHGSKYRKAILHYEEIEGSVDDPFSGAWEKLFQALVKQQYIYSKADKTKMPVLIIGIDCGYLPDVVKSFCGRTIKGVKIIPTRGMSLVTGSKKEKTIRYHWSREQRTLQINTTHYKDQIYKNSVIKYDPKADYQRYGYISYNKDLDPDYFNMLLAEQKIDGAYEKKYKSARNESLDTLVYACAVADYYLEDLATNANKSERETLVVLHAMTKTPCDI